MHEMLQKVQDGNIQNPKFTLRDGILLFKQRLCIGLALKGRVLHFVHASPSASHEGYDKTLHRARKDFYWPIMKSDIKKFIWECDTCQRVKVENLSLVGLL